MKFTVGPVVHSCPTLEAFFQTWAFQSTDLILSSKSALAPYTQSAALPCDVLYWSDYGTGEPTEAMVNAMLADIKGREYRRIVAIGGGSVMDSAKLFLFGDYTVEELYDQIDTLEKTRTLVAVPTTCGTGSEVTNILVVAFPGIGKLGLARDKLYADEAVLIPQLLQTLPYDVFASCSIDALVHAMESFLSPKAGLLSRHFSRGAIELILTHYQSLAATGAREVPVEQLEDFLTASSMAGIAITNSGCAAVHALSYPVASLTNLPHGRANYVTLEQVYRKYIEKGVDLTSLEDILTRTLSCGKEEAWNRLFALLGQIMDRDSLDQYSLTQSKAEEMAQSVLDNQQRLLSNNPIELSQEDLVDILLRS